MQFTSEDAASKALEEMNDKVCASIVYILLAQILILMHSRYSLQLLDGRNIRVHYALKK